jgi:putative SOS response-associated peptidase YedK
VCGRFAFYQPILPLLDDLGALDATDGQFGARFNVPPTAPVLIIVERLDETTGSVERTARAARWGLVPSWAKDPSIGSKMINARRETIADKPSFRSAIARRRCLVLADCYYEWHAGADPKQPYRVGIADQARAPEAAGPGTALLLAGIYEAWKDRSDPAAEWLMTCSIATGPAHPELAWLHDRTPMMLTREGADAWLDPTLTDGAAAAALLADPALALPADRLAAVPVSRDVNSPRNQGRELLAATGDPVGT